MYIISLSVTNASPMECVPSSFGVESGCKKTCEDDVDVQLSRTAAGSARQRRWRQR